MKEKTIRVINIENNYTVGRFKSSELLEGGDLFEQSATGTTFKVVERLIKEDDLVVLYCQKIETNEH